MEFFGEFVYGRSEFFVVRKWVDEDFGWCDSDWERQDIVSFIIIFVNLVDVFVQSIQNVIDIKRGFDDVGSVFVNMFGVCDLVDGEDVVVDFFVVEFWYVNNNFVVFFEFFCLVFMVLLS